jgi:hypothetical protein
MLPKRMICLLLLLTSSNAHAGDLAGQASIIGGDALEIHGTRIHLWGISTSKQDTDHQRRELELVAERCGWKVV